MKWFIFILLISCGKHESPKELDYQDNDGDQLVNEQERSEFEKNVASISRIERLNGMMRFNNEELVEIPISNQYEVEKNTLKLLVSKNNQLSQESYFSEWKKLRLLGEYQQILKREDYALFLNFEPIQNGPEELHLKGTHSRQLGKWTKKMTINLKKEELSSLLAGTSFLSLEKNYINQEETITKNTYRLFFSGQDDATVYYVSKKYSISNIIKHLNINNVLQLNLHDIFFMNAAEQEKVWFYRNLENGDKVLSLSTIKDIHAKFLAQFEHQSTHVTRKNGYPTANLILKNSFDSNIYLKIRASKTSRTFKERTLKMNNSEGGGGGKDGNGVFRWSCLHYLRDIFGETTLLPDVNNILEELVVTSKGKFIQLIPDTDFIIKEEMDSAGPYLLMKLTIPHQDIQISLKSRDKETFVTTGQYNVSCGGGQDRGQHAAYITNTEGQFNLSVESYVENFR